MTCDDKIFNITTGSGITHVRFSWGHRLSTLPNQDWFSGYIELYSMVMVSLKTQARLCYAYLLYSIVWTNYKPAVRLALFLTSLAVTVDPLIYGPVNISFFLNSSYDNFRMYKVVEQGQSWTCTWGSACIVGQVDNLIKLWLETVNRGQIPLEW